MKSRRAYLLPSYGSQDETSLFVPRADARTEALWASMLAHLGRDAHGHAGDLVASRLRAYSRRMTPAMAAAHTSLSRRHVLLATLGAAPLGCRRARPIAATSASPVGPVPWGGLDVARVSDMGDGERGGHAVIVLHGWGAPGDDLVPFAEALRRPGVRFFVPAGPLPEMGGGRAWWHLDPNTRPPHAGSDELPPGFQPTAAVTAARTAVQGLIASVVDRYAPATVSLVGFSQGAMLSIDVALAGAPVVNAREVRPPSEGCEVDRVVAMSGVLLVDSVPALCASRGARPGFLLSHGRQDPVVPFAAGSHAKDLLEKHGLPVTWHPFDGGHEIPRAVLSAVRRFLFSEA